MLRALCVRSTVCVSFEVALHNVDAALPELAFQREVSLLPVQGNGEFSAASAHVRTTTL